GRGSARRLDARAASGHAAAPPSSVMNARRFIRSPRRRVARTVPGLKQPDAGDITTGPVVARHQTQFDGILAAGENNRDRRRGRLRSQRGRGAMGRNHRDLSAHEVPCERRQSIHLTLRPAVLDADIAVLDVTVLTQALAERGNEMSEYPGR